MEFRYRVGTFFILIGLGLFSLFVLSVMSKETVAAYLIASFVALLFGFLLQRNKPRKDSGRFTSVKRARERSRQRREEKMNKPKK